MTYKIKCDRCAASSVNGIPCHEFGCNGSFTYTNRRGKEFKRFRVWSLDVWGNPRDGFEVNDRSELNETVLIPVDAPDTEIIRALKRASLLNPKCRFKSFSIDGDENNLSIDAAKTSEPIYQLEVI